MATYSNIYIDQGSTYSSVIDVKDPNGLPFNLTGYESRGQIRKSYSSPNTIVFTTNINLPLEGKVEVSLTAGQTRAMKAGRYVYDVEIFNDEGYVMRIAEGQVEINPGIANDDAVVLPPTPTLIEIIDERIDSQTVTPSFASITGKPTTLSGYGITDAASSQAFRKSLGDSGDGNGYDTLQLHPDESLSSSDQYLIVDPTAPSHIHIRAGGTQDASNAELYIGAEKNYVRVIDGQGVRIQNETTTDVNVYFYYDPVGYTSGTWYTSGENHFLQLTSTDSVFLGHLEAFTAGAPNYIQLWSPEQPPANLTYVPGTFSQVGDVYTFQVNEGHGLGETQIASEIVFGLYTPTSRINYLQLENNDFRVDVTDDIRMFADDYFLLANTSVDTPIVISTDYNNNAYEWTFGADGKLTLPNALTFDNGAKLRKGTTDTGNGGNNGIALECSAQYELKWEAGRLYTMEQDGFTIRRVDRCYNIIPTSTDDSTKGFVVGSLWVLDNGIAYVCVDNTLDSAVWNCMTSNAGRTILAATDHQAQITALTNITDTIATTINLTVEDSGKIINCTSPYAVTINMPSTDPDGNFTVAVIQGGLGMVTFEPNGKTLNSYNSLYSIAGQHAWASVTRVAPNTYNLTGTLI